MGDGLSDFCDQSLIFLICSYDCTGGEITPQQMAMPPGRGTARAPAGCLRADSESTKTPAARPQQRYAGGREHVGQQMAEVTGMIMACSASADRPTARVHIKLYSAMPPAIARLWVKPAVAEGAGDGNGDPAQTLAQHRLGVICVRQQ